MGKSAPTQTQKVDPAVAPYRDAFLRQAFGAAANQPMGFYGMQGSYLPGLSGGTGYNPANPGGGMGGIPGYGGRPRPPGGRLGEFGSSMGLDVSGINGPNFGFGQSGPMVNPGVPGAMSGTGGGQGDPAYGIGGGPGQAVGGPDPWVAGASQYTLDAMNRPMSEQAKDFFDPYQQEVIDSVRGDFNKQRTDTMAMADDVATKSRAFGGSRHGVLAAKALEGVNRNEASTLANLRSGGYQQAMQNAMGNRNFMFAGGDYMRNIGQSSIDAARGRFDTLQGLPFQRLGMMQGALTGIPMGSQTVGQKPSIWSQLLGAGMTAGSMFI